MTSYQLTLIAVNFITIIINLITIYQIGKSEKRIQELRDETESLTKRIKKAREITMKVEPSEELKDLINSVKSE